MSGIGKVDMWYDVHYIETSTEIPPKGHVLPTPDITLEGPFNPSKGREFSELRVELPFSEVLNITYLRLYYDFNNGEDQIFYAWVDDIKLMSDSENAPMVNIVYHIDLWRTYNQYFSYGSGFVVRRPSTNTDFFQNFAYRYINKKSDTPLLSNHRFADTKWWVVLAVTLESGDHKETNLSWITFPIKYEDLSLGGCEAYYVKNTMTPYFSDIISCKLDERLGDISPSQISGAWLCPMCPLPEGSIKGWGDQSSPFETNGDTNWEYYQDGGKAFKTTPTYKTGNPDVKLLREFEVEVNKTATETNPLYITGPLGEVIGAVPFGKTLGKGKVALIVSGLSAYIRMTFGAYTEGLVFDYILPSIDINSNSWSDYVYSGQRDYDIATRRLQTQGTMIEGMLGGGFMGALLGSPSFISKDDAMPGKNRKGVDVIVQGLMNLLGLSKYGAEMGLGMGVGAVIGMGSSLISGLFQQNDIDPQLQQANDSYHARQLDTVIMSGDYLYVYDYGDCDIHVTEVQIDDESLAIVNENKEVQGVSYGQSMSDCTALIEGGGPMQINNLIITGNAPIMAKKAIQAKFAAGVRIVSR